MLDPRWAPQRRYNASPKGRAAAARARLRYNASPKGKAHMRAGSLRRAALLLDLKAAPCTDCGVSYPACVMDFDHVPERGPKVASVGVLAASAGWSAVLAEIAKCDLICANCHRLRTAARRAT